MERKTARLAEKRIGEVRRRLEAWRSKGRRRRIPEVLWQAAAKLAGQVGVHRVARTLGLDYYELKRRAQAGISSRGEVAAGVSGASPPAFVEVALSGPRPSEACVLEVENRAGTRVRVRLERVAVDEIGAIARSLWSLGA